MRALILAAGTGTRLRPLTVDRPKCLVEIAGRSILQHQIDALHAVGIDDIVVVTGYRAEMIEEKFAKTAKLLHNPDYSKTGSLHTMMLAKDQIEGAPFVLLNADLVFSADMLNRLIKHPAQTAVLVDNRLPRLDGEMNVVVNNGMVAQISKMVPAKDADAQSLQIIKFSAEDSSLLFLEAEKLGRTQNTQLFPANAYHSIISQSSMAAVQAAEGFWHEVDTLEDFDNCERLFLQYV